MIRGSVWRLNRNLSKVSSFFPMRFSSQMSLNPPNGTRDFYPEDVQSRMILHNLWQTVAKQFGFEQVDTPVVEYEDLYDRSTQESLYQQYYRFQDSSKGHKMNLKADMTPSLCRLIVSNHPQATYPIKWFSIPQLWRYEKENPGRRKEHYQWNMDIWGVAGVEAEAELISAAVTSLKNLGLTSADVVIKVNNRSIISESLSSLGVSADKWSDVFIVLDKLLHASGEECEQIDYQTTGISKEVLNELINRQLSLTVESLQDSEGGQELLKLFTLLDQYGIKDWVQFDASIVRGLAYYTGIVFEAFDREGQLGAICGGGRYNDMLLPMFVIHGEYPTTAVGFGMGDATIEELLKRKGLTLKDKN